MIIELGRTANLTLVIATAMHISNGLSHSGEKMCSRTDFVGLCVALQAPNGTSGELTLPSSCTLNSVTCAEKLIGR